MRIQVVGVIIVATCVEYTASPFLGYYTYRLHNVPSYVPPGHGLVYLAALSIGRSQMAILLRRPFIVVHARGVRRVGRSGASCSLRARMRSARSCTSSCFGSRCAAAGRWSTPARSS